MLEILQFPFFQRALLAGVLLALLLAFYGTFVVLRRMSFFADGMAHASLAGIAVGILVAWNPLGTALVLAALAGYLVYLLERKLKLAGDTAIGIIFTAGMALGVVLLGLKSGYQPELMGFLFGNILSVARADLILIAAIGMLVLTFLVLNFRPLALLALDRESAVLSGVRIGLLDPLFYVLLSVSVVLGIKVLGIILVSALLITPVATAKVLATSLRQTIALAIILGELAVLLGLFASFWLNLPSGPSIVLVSAIIFALVATAKAFRK